MDNKENKKTNKARQIILPIVGLLISAGLMVGSYFIIDHFVDFGHDKDDVQELDTPSNLRYDEKTFILSWDEVLNANSYIVSINGKNNDVEDNEFYYIPISEVTEFKVMAFDTTGAYESSTWSSTYTYTIENTNEFNYVNMHKYVDNMYSDRSLKKIVGMYAEGNELFTFATFDYEGKDKFYEIRATYDSTINSLEELLTKKYSFRDILESYDVLPYNTAEYFLQSNSFHGELEQRRLEGYKIEVVSSQAVQNDVSSETGAYVFATYKLSRGNEIKYVHSNILVVTNKYNSNEEAMFTTDIVAPSKRWVEEISYTELKGDEIEFAEMLSDVKGPKMTTKVSNPVYYIPNYSNDDGYEF